MFVRTESSHLASVDSASKMVIIWEHYTLTNHAVTKRSASGVYYSENEVSIAVAGYRPFSATITYWTNLPANVTPYIGRDPDRIGLLCDTSITVGGITICVGYKKTY